MPENEDAAMLATDSAVSMADKVPSGGAFLKVWAEAACLHASRAAFQKKPNLTESITITIKGNAIAIITIQRASGISAMLVPIKLRFVFLPTAMVSCSIYRG